MHDVPKLNHPGFTGGQNSRSIAPYGTESKEDMEQNQKKKTSKPYSPEFRQRAVRLAMEHRDDYQSEAAALTAVSGKLGCSPDSLRTWVRQVQRDGGERPGPTSAEIARSEPLRRHWFEPNGERA